MPTVVVLKDIDIFGPQRRHKHTKRHKLQVQAKVTMTNHAIESVSSLMTPPKPVKLQAPRCRSRGEMSDGHAKLSVRNFSRDPSQLALTPCNDAPKNNIPKPDSGLPGRTKSMVEAGSSSPKRGLRRMNKSTGITKTQRETLACPL